MQRVFILKILGAEEIAQWLEHWLLLQRGLRLYCQQPHAGSQPSVTLAEGDLTPFSDHEWYTDIRAGTTPVYIRVNKPIKPFKIQISYICLFQGWAHSTMYEWR